MKKEPTVVRALPRWRIDPFNMDYITIVTMVLKEQVVLTCVKDPRN